MPDGYQVTERGLARLCDLGVAVRRGGSRPVYAPLHVDWSERRHHLAGPIAVALIRRLLDLGWFARMPASRALRLTEAGRAGLREQLRLDLPAS